MAEGERWVRGDCRVRVSRLGYLLTFVWLPVAAHRPCETIASESFALKERPGRIGASMNADQTSRPTNRRRRVGNFPRTQRSATTNSMPKLASKPTPQLGATMVKRWASKHVGLALSTITLTVCVDEDSFLGGLTAFQSEGGAARVVAGVTLASMNIPQVPGYARIAGMPWSLGFTQCCSQSLRSRSSVLAPSCRGCQSSYRRYIFRFAD